MSPADDVIVDLDHALDRLESAGSDEVETRRALREALACIYELRAYREGNSSEKIGYRKRSGSSQGGQHAESIVWLRGKMTHDLIAQITPESEKLYPSEHTFPSPHLYPGSNLTWAPTSHLRLATGPTELARRTLYEDLLRGQPVLAGLHFARDFLANDPGPRA